MVDNVISIEENAEYLLNTNSDLNIDEDISRAVIYQNLQSRSSAASPRNKHQKYKRGYQPLLTSATQHTKYLNSYGDEDVLLNPNTHRSTMSIGGQPTSLDDHDDHTDAPYLTPPHIHLGIFSLHSIFIHLSLHSLQI